MNHNDAPSNAEAVYICDLFHSAAGRGESGNPSGLAPSHRNDDCNGGGDHDGIACSQTVRGTEQAKRAERYWYGRAEEIVVVVLTNTRRARLLCSSPAPVQTLWRLCTARLLAALGLFVVRMIRCG